MRVLKEGATGEDVRAWENFLVGQGYNAGEVDGVFDTATKAATAAFQKTQELVPDGEAGNKTIGIAMGLGFPLLEDPVNNDKFGPNWPPRPDLNPLTSTIGRQQLFGTFAYVASPTPGNPEAIRVTDGWFGANVQRVLVQQLGGGRVVGASRDGTVLIHKRGANRLLALFAAWDQAGLMPLVLSWAGSYAPRFIRGSRTVLSNHAFATAFDINVPWNMLGVQPALVGTKGSVRELVPIANSLGWFWGGHYEGSRPDGMHFELCIVD